VGVHVENSEKDVITLGIDCSLCLRKIGISADPDDDPVAECDTTRRDALRADNLAILNDNTL
jgi:hypothetical protein